MNRNLTCCVCKTATSKYTCPRCRVPYCSLNCYNQHSNNCTESFYKDHVQNELSLRSGGTSLTGPETVREKSKMLDILKRTANNEEFDERDLQLEMQQLEIIANKNEKDVVFNFFMNSPVGLDTNPNLNFLIGRICHRPGCFF